MRFVTFALTATTLYFTLKGYKAYLKNRAVTKAGGCDVESPPEECERIETIDKFLIFG